MLGPILIGAGAVVTGILGYAAMRPDQFRVERSTLIDAPPEKVFATISDFHQWGGVVAVGGARSGDETDSQRRD